MYNKIIFITNEIRPRTLKHAASAKIFGYEVKIYTTSSYQLDTFYGIKISVVDSIELIIARCKQESNAVFHINSVWNNTLPLSFIKSKLHPLVYDTYDLLNGCCNPYHKDYPSQETLDIEAFCLLNSDIQIFRDDRYKLLPSYVLDKLNFYVVYDGCLCDTVYNSLENVSNRINSFTYCGNVVSPWANSERNYHFEFAARLKRYNCEYHVYPLLAKSFYEYSVFIKESMPDISNLAVHEPQNYPDILSSLTKHQVGVDLCSINGPRSLTDNDFYKIELTDLAGNNKVYDYLDAGLEIVINGSVFFRKLLMNIDKVYFITKFEEIFSNVKFSEKRNYIPERFKLTSIGQELHSIYESL